MFWQGPHLSAFDVLVRSVFDVKVRSAFVCI